MNKKVMPIDIESLIDCANNIMGELDGYFADDLNTDDRLEMVDLIRREVFNFTMDAMRKENARWFDGGFESGKLFADDQWKIIMNRKIEEKLKAAADAADDWFYNSETDEVEDTRLGDYIRGLIDQNEDKEKIVSDIINSFISSPAYSDSDMKLKHQTDVKNATKFILDAINKENK